MTKNIYSKAYNEHGIIWLVKKQTLCLRSIKRQGYPFPPLLFYTVPEIPISAIKQDTKSSRKKRRLKDSINNEFKYVKESMKPIQY